MPRLLSSTILHRHGSRGPGASELSPFARDHPVHSQWHEDELEELSYSGHIQIVVLGAWFARKYVLSGLLDAGEGKTYWRCSKSDRAVESGYDFVKGFNDTLQTQAVGPKPAPYDVDPDNFFRPWKVFKKEAGVIKERMKTEEVWHEKAKENEPFLTQLCQQHAKCQPTVCSTKALWCMTYFHALREVENFWPAEHSTRNKFCSMVPSDVQSKVTQLALWVWEQRFLHSGFKCEMGGRISVELIDSILSGQRSINIFSGHDYTLLGVLAALDLVERFDYASGFGAYLIFELWDTRNENDMNRCNQDLMVKIILNPDPFRDSSGNVDISDVHEENQVILAEIPVIDLLDRAQKLRDQISLLPPPKPLSKPALDLGDSQGIDLGALSSPKVVDELDLLS